MIGRREAAVAQPGKQGRRDQIGRRARVAAMAIRTQPKIKIG
jgi:hypothetical protein